MSKKQIAFTLIELLVVIAIIGILSGLIVVTMSGVTQKANIAKFQVFSNSLRNALMLNLVSEWRLDGNVNDSWSAGNNGTWYGSGGGTNTSANYRPSSECVSGQCLNFDGTDDYVYINDSDFLDTVKDLTVSIWIKKMGTGTGATPGIIAKRDGSSGWGLIWQTTSSADNISSRIYQGDGTAVNLDPFNIDANQWQFIVLVADSSSNKVRIYKNAQAQGVDKAYNGTIFAGTSPMYIGQQSSAYFNGSIDEVRFFNSAVPIAQIRESYYAGLNSLSASGMISGKEYSSRIDNITKDDI